MHKMNKMPLGVLALIVLASPAITTVAQQAPDPLPSGDSVQVKIGKDRVQTEPYVLAPREFSTYAQPYQMETGQVLMFEQQRHRYYAQVRNEARVEIFPLASGVFSSANGTLFVFRDDGESLAVSHLERLPFAGNNLIDPVRVIVSVR